jgi:hypothetical protein
MVAAVATAATGGDSAVVSAPSAMATGGDSAMISAPSATAGSNSPNPVTAAGPPGGGGSSGEPADAAATFVRDLHEVGGGNQLAMPGTVTAGRNASVARARSTRGSGAGKCQRDGETEDQLHRESPGENIPGPSIPGARGRREGVLGSVKCPQAHPGSSMALSPRGRATSREKRRDRATNHSRRLARGAAG